MSQTLKSFFAIGNRSIGPDYPPLVIAEMSGNHNQSLDRALQIVDAAAASGAHALKLQTYTADTITLSRRGGDFEINDSSSLWVEKISTTFMLRRKRHGIGMSQL